MFGTIREVVACWYWKTVDLSRMVTWYMPTHCQDGNIDFIVGQAKFSYVILRHLNPLFFAASVAWIICLLPGKDQLWSTTTGYSPIGCIPTFVDCSALPLLAVYDCWEQTFDKNPDEFVCCVIWHDMTLFGCFESCGKFSKADRDDIDSIHVHV